MSRSSRSRWNELVMWSRIMRSQSICSSVNFSPDAAVALHDPVLEVLPHRVGIRRDRFVDAADTADQRHKRRQLVDRIVALVIVEMCIGLPDAQRRELGPVVSRACRATALIIA